MAIELIFRDENGKNIEQTLIVDAEFIIRDDHLKEYLKGYFLEECSETLNESLVLAEIIDI